MNTLEWRLRATTLELGSVTRDSIGDDEVATGLPSYVGSRYMGVMANADSAIVSREAELVKKLRVHQLVRDNQVERMRDHTLCIEQINSSTCIIEGHKTYARAHVEGSACIKRKMKGGFCVRVRAMVGNVDGELSDW